MYELVDNLIACVWPRTEELGIDSGTVCQRSLGQIFYLFCSISHVTFDLNVQKCNGFYSWRRQTLWEKLVMICVELLPGSWSQTNIQTPMITITSEKIPL